MNNEFPSNITIYCKRQLNRPTKQLYLRLFFSITPQVRVDHRSKTVHFGTELAEAQSVTENEGPHLQDMPSEQVGL